jgi:hypothetical protein
MVGQMLANIGLIWSTFNWPSLVGQPVGRDPYVEIINVASCATEAPAT